MNKCNKNPRLHSSYREGHSRGERSPRTHRSNREVADCSGGSLDCYSEVAVLTHVCQPTSFQAAGNLGTLIRICLKRHRPRTINNRDCCDRCSLESCVVSSPSSNVGLYAWKPQKRRAIAPLAKPLLWLGAIATVGIAVVVVVPQLGSPPTEIASQPRPTPVVEPAPAPEAPEPLAPVVEAPSPTEPQPARSLRTASSG